MAAMDAYGARRRNEKGRAWVGGKMGGCLVVRREPAPVYIRQTHLSAAKLSHRINLESAEVDGGRELRWIRFALYSELKAIDDGRLLCFAPPPSTPPPTPSSTNTRRLE